MAYSTYLIVMSIGLLLLYLTTVRSLIVFSKYAADPVPIILQAIYYIIPFSLWIQYLWEIWITGIKKS